MLIYPRIQSILNMQFALQLHNLIVLGGTPMIWSMERDGQLMQPYIARDKEQEL